jgi:hypothetical protein
VVRQTMGRDPRDWERRRRTSRLTSMRLGRAYSSVTRERKSTVRGGVKV